MTSLRVQLTWRLVAGIVTLLAVASICIYLLSRHILRADFDARLFSTAQAALSSISQKGSSLDIDWDELPQMPKRKQEAGDLIQILDSSLHSLGGNLILSPEQLRKTVRDGYFNLDAPQGKLRVMRLSFQPRVEEEDIGVTPPSLRKTCVLLVASDRGQLEASLRKLALMLIAMTSATGLLGAAFISSILRGGFRPLNQLGTAVAKVEAESLGQKIAVDHLPSELIGIAEKLNDLLDRLGISFARERRFSADVSHELRTPIAELKTLSEVMLRGTDKSSEFHRAFQDTLEIACQMESLVIVLLEIVRQEENQAVLPLAQVDLGEMVGAIWTKFEKEAARKEIKLQAFPQTTPQSVRTEPRLLSVILSNLFSNAIEYSPSGGVVGVELQHDENALCLIVRNVAENLAPADLTHIFERFWRKDKARGNPHHLGIGLSLTRTLCQRLGIHLTVSMNGGNLIRFWLRFPPQVPAS